MKKIERQKIILIVQIFIIFTFIFSIIISVNLRGTLRETRNLVRGRHMEMIINAIHTYYIVNNNFPECIPVSGESVEVEKCQEVGSFLTSFPRDPLVDENYFVEYFNKRRENVRVFSSAPEAKEVEVIR